MFNICKPVINNIILLRKILSRDLPLVVPTANFVYGKVSLSVQEIKFVSKMKHISMFHYNPSFQPHLLSAVRRLK